MVGGGKGSRGADLGVYEFRGDVCRAEFVGSGHFCQGAGKVDKGVAAVGRGEEEEAYCRRSNVLVWLERTRGAVAVGGACAGTVGGVGWRRGGICQGGKR